VAEPIVFLLGAMVMLGDQELAIGLGVLTAPVLAYGSLTCRRLRGVPLFS